MLQLVTDSILVDSLWLYYHFKAFIVFCQTRGWVLLIKFLSSIKFFLQLYCILNNIYICLHTQGYKS